MISYIPIILSLAKVLEVRSISREIQIGFVFWCEISSICLNSWIFHQLRPYLADHTRSRLISKVKLPRAPVVLSCVSRWEGAGAVVFFLVVMTSSQWFRMEFAILFVKIRKEEKWMSVVARLPFQDDLRSWPRTPTRENDVRRRKRTLYQIT